MGVASPTGIGGHPESRTHGSAPPPLEVAVPLKFERPLLPRKILGGPRPPPPLEFFMRGGGAFGIGKYQFSKKIACGRPI